MRKLVVVTLLAFTVIGFSAIYVNPALAQTDPFSTACQEARDNGTPESELPSTCDPNLGENDPITGADGEGVLVKVTELVAMLAGVAAVIAVMLGGIEYVISAGDPAKLNTAKNTILFGLVGAVVAMTAGLILRFVLVRV